MAAIDGWSRPGSAPGRDRARRLGLRLGVLAVLITSWQVAGNDSVQLTFPTFTRTVASFWQLLVSGELVRGLVQSNQAMVIGYVLALSIAIPLGVLMGAVSLLERIVKPYLTVMLALPLIAVLPLVQTVLGLGLASRVFVVFLFSFVYVTVNTTVGVRSAAHDLREMARSFGATGLQTLRHVILPAAFPSIMAGARLGLGRAIVGMVIAELFLVGQGIGNMLLYYRSQFDPGAVLALALVMIGEGVIVMTLARRVEARYTRSR